MRRPGTNADVRAFEAPTRGTPQGGRPSQSTATNHSRRALVVTAASATGGTVDVGDSQRLARRQLGWPEVVRRGAVRGH